MSPKKASSSDKTSLFSRPTMAGIFAFAFLFFLGFFIIYQRYQIIKEAEGSETMNVMRIVEQNLNHSLKDSYSVALSMALLIDDEGSITNFEENAPILLQQYPVIDAIQMVTGGVIQKVYPYEFNKAVIGYNILKDPKTEKEALKAVNARKLYFAGPIELKQGGIAVVGRLPVFKKNKFWGFSAVIIKLESLINQAHLEELAGDKYIFKFSKIDESTGKEHYFLNEAINVDYNLAETIVLPDGEWKFYIAPKNPQDAFFELFSLAFFILLISIWLAWVMTNLFKQPLRLQALVNSQAGKLANSELKLELFLARQLLVW